jgi:phage shock protein E
MSFFNVSINALAKTGLLLVLLLVSRGSVAAPEANTVWIDVRTADEYAEAHLPAAVNIPYQVIAEHIAEYADDKNTPIVVYCRSGRRAGKAKSTLEQLGYSQVINATDLDGARRLYQQKNATTATDTPVPQ